MQPQVVYGNIVEQDVDVIINPWNRNIIPWWLLLPQGVSKEIKRKGGYEPFKELAQFGPMALGCARLTSAGRLPFKAIIHVAGINMFWMASKYSIATSVINAMRIVNEKKFSSVAFPLIGSGSGNRGKTFSLKTMMETFQDMESTADVRIVRYQVR
ncbi:MAG: Appr-1-p processing protein [Desulfobacteraceae bacterium]|nr:MAG: Appr-1-p processing protein [Desulfobacteraceae bacterium]